MDIEEIKKYLKENENNPEVSALVNSLSDKRVNQALEKYKSGVETEKLAALQAQIAQLQRERNKSILKDVAKSAGVPAFLLDYAIGETEEETLKKSGELLSAYTDSIKKGVMDEVNRRLGGTAPKGGGVPEAKSLKNMTSEEIYKSLDVLNQGNSGKI